MNRLSVNICSSIDIWVAEAIDEGRMTIVERTEECCIRIDNHGQKIQEAPEASCRMLQVDGACLDKASTIKKMTLVKLSSAFDPVVLPFE
jgi:hypothetical protein